MTYAKILVPVTGSQDDSLALATAFAAAGPSGAHVEALFVHPNPREVASYIYSGAPMSPELVQSIIDGQSKLADDAQAAARSALVATAKDAGATLASAPQAGKSVTCSFRVRLGFIPHAIAEASRLSDLVVFKSVTESERHELATSLVDTLTRAGRPVVLAPQLPVTSLVRKIVIGWDGSYSAAHAATAALPFLKAAAAVEILSVRRTGNETAPRAEALQEYLALHQVSATSREVPQEQRSISACLLESAAKSGAELLVMGGYGHSHLREAILGGVTLETVHHHSLPVFLMH